MESLKFKIFVTNSLSPTRRKSAQWFGCSQLPTYLFSCFLILASSVSFAQDIHFAQFHATPANINPGLTGAFNGDYRFIGNQRTQWRSVSGNPYRTLGLSADAANIFDKKNIGGGLSIYNDKTGDSQFSTLQINMGGAYHMLTSDSLHRLSGGLQLGITQRSINYNALSFDNQYNGEFYDAGRETGENFNTNGYLNLNVNAGITWHYSVKDNLRFSSGISLYNIPKSKQSFFNDNSIRLDRRLAIFCRAEYDVNEKITLLPSLLFMNQGKFKEALLGSSFKYLLGNSEYSYRALYAGAWWRAKDAGVVYTGMDYNNVNIGISYDFTLSDLNPASRYRGGLEVSVIYIIKKFRPVVPKYKTCPSFI